LARRTGIAGPTKLGYVLCLLGVVTITALLLAYFYFEIGRKDSLWSGIFGSVIAAIVVSTGGYLALASRGVSLPSMQTSDQSGALISFYPTHEDVDWDVIIEHSRSLDIVVHYYGRWASLHYDSFVAFFRRGGKLRLIMADPDIAPTMDIVREQFFPYLNAQQLLDKIAETVRVLRDALEEAGSRKAVLKVYYFPKVLHYAFVLSNDRTLYLSAYDQFKGTNIRAPVFGIDLSKDDRLEGHWHGNRDRFIAESREGEAA
jgi:hypothetical protein